MKGVWMFLAFTTGFLLPSPWTFKRELACTVYMYDVATGRLHPVNTGIGYIKGDTLVCQLK
jgi:hypothetical protein